MTSQQAFELAKRKARYSDFDWVVWKDKSGTFYAERATYQSIKKALLAVGTQGKFNVIQSRTAWSHLCGWRSGVNEMLHRRRGWVG